MALRTVKCVLFDMDGLLLDTERLYSQGTQQILSEYNQTYDWTFKKTLMGKRSDEVAKQMVEKYNLPFQPQEWIDRSSKVYQELFPSVKIMPGVMKLVHHLSKSGVPIAVATSSSSSSFSLKTSHHQGLFSLFCHIVKGDDPRVARAKPAPDIFLVAAAQFSPPFPPEDCLVLEDAPLGVEAGVAAGMQVLMVPDEWIEQKDEKNATHVVRNLDNFDPTLFGLPGYNYTPVTHVIFDMDGLLLNTQNMYSQVSSSILAQHGKTPCWEFKMSVIGRRAEDVSEMAVKYYDLPYTGEEYLDICTKQLHKLFPECQLMPGVEKLVRHLHAMGIPIAVATSSSRKVFDIKTIPKHKDFFSLFCHITTGCDPSLAQAKPAPDIFKLCKERFSDNPPAGRCLVFEDAPNGVEAAVAAEMQVVMIPHPKVGKEYMVAATQVLSSMVDFRPTDFGLPSF